MSGDGGALGPRITVGIPVYNGAATLHRAVESVLAQTCPVTAIHISDNASTDETAALARELAMRSSTVRVTSHSENLGLSSNFGFVLKQAETEYFMWLAADDYLEPTYVERMLEALEADSSLVACVSRTRFLRGDGTTRLATGTFPLMGDTVSNLAAYLSGPSDNTRIFGVYRTPALKAAFTPSYFHAYDWAVAAGTLLHGRHREVSEILMVRDETPNVAYVRAVRRDNPTAFGRLFPAASMTRDLVQRQKIPLRPSILKALLRINLELHLHYCLTFHPRYGRAIKPLLRKYVLWRLAAPQSSVAGGGQTGVVAGEHAD